MALSVDLDRFNAVLIGSSTFTKDFKDVPQIRNNIDKISKLLINENVLGLEESNIANLLDKPNNEVIRGLRKACNDPLVETILIYYAGHGHRTDRTQLYLTSPNTYMDNIEVTGIDYDLFKKIIDRSKAKQKIIILDCCYSGIATLGENGVLTSKEEEISGTYILTSSPHDDVSYFDDATDSTFFSKELIDLLEHGVEKKKNYFTISDIHKEIRERLLKKELPEPQRKDNLNVEMFNLFRNLKQINENYKRKEIFRIQESSFWESTTAINELEGFRNYLKTFPSGQFVNKAMAQIDRLTGKTTEETKEDFPMRSFKTIGPFTQFGLAPASYNGKYGYINSDWEEVIPFMYDWASTFHAGTAEVILDGRKLLIDKSGNIVE